MTNSHPIARDEIMAWLDGELEPARAAVVRTHVDACDSCRGVAEELRLTSIALAEWEPDGPPASFDARIRRAADEALGGAARRSWWPGFGGFSGWSLAVASAAAVLLVSVTGVAVWRAMSPPAVPEMTLAADRQSAADRLDAPGPAAGAAASARPAAPEPKVEVPVQQAKAASPPPASQPVATPPPASPAVAMPPPVAPPATTPPAGNAAASDVTVTAAAPVADLKRTTIAPPPPPAQVAATPPPAAAGGAAGAAATTAAGPPVANAAPPASIGAAAGLAASAERSAVREEAAAPPVAVTATLVLEAASPADLRARVEAMAGDAGGRVSELSVARDPDGRPRLGATLRVPRGALDATLQRLRALGAVREDTRATEDLSAEQATLAARARDLEEQDTRLQALRDRPNRAGRGGGRGGSAATDPVALERQLGLVRSERTDVEAASRALADRAAYATITLRIVGP
ncbi:MAG: DUF4349 domain-containing protein [Vicinamibacterales bacterium]